MQRITYVLLASLGSVIASSVDLRHGTFAELASLRHPHNVSRAAVTPSVQLTRSSRNAHITYVMRCVRTINSAVCREYG